MTRSHRRRQRVRRWCTGALAAAVLTGGCSGGSGPNDGQGTDITGDVTSSTALPAPQTLLRVGAEDWPACLNPITCDSPALREQVLQHVLPVALELTPDGRFEPSPLLADTPGVEVTGDGMVVTYRITEAARWSDGTPVTSSDFRATWEAIMATPGADVEGYDRIEQVDDADPLVAAVHFAERYGDWRLLFGGGDGWILEADALGGSSDVTGLFRTELPMSAAPYRLAAWDGDEAVLAANDEYWDADRAPQVDQVRMVRVTIDDLVNPAAFDLLVRAPGAEPGEPPEGFDERTLPTTRVLGLWFDRRTPLLQPVQHRQVLATLADRAALARLVAGRDAPTVDCLGWVPDVGAWCDAAAGDLPDYDPDLAVYVLATLGWVPDETGALRREDTTFAVPISHDPDDPASTAVAEALATSLESAGVGVTPVEITTSEWLAPRTIDQNTGLGVYSMDLGVSPRVDDLYGCVSGLPSSVLAWCEPEMVSLSSTLAATPGSDEELRIVRRIGAIAEIDVAWVPIAQVRTSVYVRTDVVTIPDELPIAGGALAQLYRFEVS